MIEMTTPYTPLLGGVAVAAFVLAAAMWRYRRTAGVVPLELLALGAGWWSFFYGLELASTSLERVLFYARLEYLGIVFIPVCWLAFARSYTAKPFSRRALLFLCLFPALTLTLVWTNAPQGFFPHAASHGLIWSQVGLGGAPPRLEVQHGVFFWLHTAYSYGLMLIGTALMARFLWRSPGRYRGQSVVLLGGVTAPLVTSTLYLIGVSDGYDLTPLGFAVASALIAWGMFRYKLFELVPVARGLVIESMSDGVFVVDASRRIIDANPAILRIVQRTEQAFVGCDVAEVFGDRPEALARYRDLTEPRQEVMMVDGRVFELHLSPLKRGGETGATVVVVRDVTERVEGERELRRAKVEAEAADRAKTQFLANMSHELRTPLTAIIGFSELLTLTLPDEKNREYANLIFRSGEELLGRISSALTLALTETQELRLEPTTFRLPALLQEVADTFEKTITARGNRFHLNLADDLGELYTDPDKLREVVAQLLSNAAKFTEGGEVRLSASVVKVEQGLPTQGEHKPNDALNPKLNPGLEPGLNHVLITVADTGIGVAAEHLPVIFDAFVQVDASNTRAYGGSGVGLTLCKRLCELLGGDITVQSAVGVGSTFTVRLPARAPAELHETAPPGEIVSH